MYSLAAVVLSLNMRLFCGTRFSAHFFFVVHFEIVDSVLIWMPCNVLINNHLRSNDQ